MITAEEAREQSDRNAYLLQLGSVRKAIESAIEGGRTGAKVDKARRPEIDGRVVGELKSLGYEVDLSETGHAYFITW